MVPTGERKFASSLRYVTYALFFSRDLCVAASRQFSNSARELELRKSLLRDDITEI